MKCSDCNLSYKKNLFGIELYCSIGIQELKAPSSERCCSKNIEEIEEIKTILDYYKMKNREVKKNE